MSLATLYNVPDSEALLNLFSFSNQDHHRLIIDAIQRQKGIILPLYPIDPIPLFDINNWARNHQQMHGFTSVLGINASDFTSVNLENKEEWAAWIILHAQEHLQADTILGLGG